MSLKFNNQPRHNPVLATLRQGGRTYEQRLNDCGKANCRKCGGDGARQASHGPYWYLCVLLRHKWVRIYLGKELDTARFVDATGEVDWEAVKAWKVRKATTVVPVPQNIAYHRFHDDPNPTAVSSVPLDPSLPPE